MLTETEKDQGMLLIFLFSPFFFTLFFAVYHYQGSSTCPFTDTCIRGKTWVYILYWALKKICQGLQLPMCELDCRQKERGWWFSPGQEGGGGGVCVDWIPSQLTCSFSSTALTLHSILASQPTCWRGLALRSQKQMVTLLWGKKYKIKINVFPYTTFFFLSLCSWLCSATPSTSAKTGLTGFT